VVEMGHPEGKAHPIDGKEAANDAHFEGVHGHLLWRILPIDSVDLMIPVCKLQINFCIFFPKHFVFMFSKYL